VFHESSYAEDDKQSLRLKTVCWWCYQ